MFAFVLCSHRKFITLRILDREEYEKECSFFLVLGDPVWLRRGVKGVRVTPDQLSRRCRPLFSVSPYSHTPFSSHSGARPFCPPSFEAWPLQLFTLFSFLFCFWGGLCLAGEGSPRYPGGGPRHPATAASFSSVENPASRSKRHCLVFIRR